MKYIKNKIEILGVFILLVLLKLLSFITFNNNSLLPDDNIYDEYNEFEKE